MYIVGSGLVFIQVCAFAIHFYGVKKGQPSGRKGAEVAMATLWSLGMGRDMASLAVPLVRTFHKSG